MRFTSGSVLVSQARWKASVPFIPLPRYADDQPDLDAPGTMLRQRDFIGRMPSQWLGRARLHTHRGRSSDLRQE